MKYEDLAIQALKNGGFKITMPRVLVIRALSRSNKALDAYSIHDSILTDGGKIDVVSVYRILETLRECHLIYQVGKLDGRYVRCEKPHLKGNSTLLVNKAACTVVDVSPGVDAAQVSNVAKSFGLESVGYQLEIEVTS